MADQESEPAVEAPPAEEEESLQQQETSAAPDDANTAEESKNGDEVIGSSAMRPVFLGNLIPGYTAEQVTDIFERPVQPKSEKQYEPISVDRIDQKRGYCFIFLKDATTQADKERVESFISDLNGL